MGIFFVRNFIFCFFGKFINFLCFCFVVWGCIDGEGRGGGCSGVGVVGFIYSISLRGRICFVGCRVYVV